MPTVLNLTTQRHPTASGFAYQAQGKPSGLNTSNLSKHPFHLMEDAGNRNHLSEGDAIEHVSPKIKLAPKPEVELESPINVFNRSAIGWLVCSLAAFFAGAISAGNKNLIGPVIGLSLGGFGLWQGQRKGRQVELENQMIVERALARQRGETVAPERKKPIASIETVSENTR